MSGSAGEVAGVLLPTLSGGGAERAMLLLARGLRERGLGVDLLTFRAEGELAGAVPAGVGLVELGARNIREAVPRLARYLRRRRPGRLFAAMEAANIAAVLARLLALAPTRVVVGIRNTLSQSLDVAAGRRLPPVLRMARLVYPWADAVVAVSDGAADDAARLLGLPRQRITSIGNPVITPELEALAAADPGHPWFAPGQPPVVLGCGRLVPQKDFPMLLDAFARLRSERPCRLVILGDGPEREALIARAQGLGAGDAVDLPGFVANPFAFMARAGAFALSSRFEGSPNVLVQAIACGSPVVATDCPCGPREILDGVAAGRLVPVGDDAALAVALAELLDLPRPQALALPRFDYRAATAAYLAAADG